MQCRSSRHKATNSQSFDPQSPLAVAQSYMVVSKSILCPISIPKSGWKVAYLNSFIKSSWNLTSLSVQSVPGARNVVLKW